MKRKKLVIISAVFLLCLLLFMQFGKSREQLAVRRSLESEIEARQKQILILENKYTSAESSEKTPVREQKYNLKDSTAQILAEIKLYDLELIDFSSGENELNLNLQGEFKSILSFIYYLETKLKFLEIAEFKIKDDSRNLFFFIKLKNELI
ncbi:MULTISPECIES: hypothetical protein [Halanaerobium]|uniref:Uncharacterized protein n=1 Tax=Halanaerobium saccharolyticum TaxID=43595 RepID=A0A4R6SBR0_9FIRM|nr:MULTISPECIES: hypothetical protein [Halanaerobium]PUU89784.1 MAG: hypothetical protein CI949_2602 [Halanaerobium sp.]PUU90691.1 MAG: hypothetical protein CI947_1392 [Halanaerobium sp.]TDP96983.1 hypothetical protein C7957_10678 [Halanaerobium saccharolyticum]